MRNTTNLLCTATTCKAARFQNEQTNSATKYMKDISRFLTKFCAVATDLPALS